MQDSNQKVVEMHTIAAHAHLAAAQQHGKGERLSAHEASRIALEHATKAFELSQAAHRESEKAAAK